MAEALTDLLGIWDRAELLEDALLEGQAGIPTAARAFAVAGLARRAAPLLVVVPRSRDAESFAGDLAPWTAPGEVEVFPAWEVLPGEALSPTLETMGRRIRLARLLRGGGGPLILVAPVRAFVQQLGEIAEESIRLALRAEVPLEEISRRLAVFGFERNYLVERPGEFAVRGGILDVFPPGRPSPVRADFFGDEISSLREFFIGSQRSRGEVAELEILPVRELRLDASARARAAALAATAGGDDPATRAARVNDLERLAQGLVFPGMEAYLAPLAASLQPLAELLPAGGTVVVMDPKQCRDRTTEFLAQANEWGTDDTAPLFVDFDEAVAGRSTLEIWAYARGGEGIDLPATGWDDFAGRPDRLAAALRQHRAAGATIAVAVGRAAARARDLLAEADLTLPLAAPKIGAASVSDAQVGRGFLLRLGDAPVLAVVGESDVFGKRRPAPTPTAGEPVEERARASALLLQLAAGDHMVHEVYGVGRYLGMVPREIAGVSRDYLLLEYAGDDRLYVPTDQLGAVTKYTGGEAPRLNRLGTGDWEKAKSRARRAVREIAQELVALYAKRAHSPGHAFAADTPWQRELEDAFAHVETPDQLRAVEEVKADMERPVPMDRLVCGDVGYGKTEVAVRAAFKAVQESKQVVVLVPTTILAQQHFETFSDRFAPFPSTVAQLSRFLSPREQADALERLAAGTADVVVGTHRLLQKDVKFHDLGLVIVDEEQRFGVQHKEAMKRLRTSVDVLTLSATPIPRTLEMSLTGVRDMSLVDTPPADRRPVLTYVGTYDERMVVAAIRRELARDGQVFVVHNRVRSIEGAARRIQGLVPDARVEVAHGQMSEAELEGVMVEVWDGKVDVLVCTTIIESGLDIPTMNTLIVERADRLGLAQLYQLRGRVGRARERAYAYFFYPAEEMLTEEAHERLKTLSEYTELGSGFKIALRDLEIRGAGNLLGAEQSGHIAAVGFDLYVKMMTEAVQSMIGTKPEEKLDVRIDLPADAFVPAAYIARESLRIETYRRIEQLRSAPDAAELRAELEDLYGPVPEPVSNLLTVAELRAFLAEQGIEEVGVRNGILRVRPLPTLRDSQEVRLQRLFPKAEVKEVTRTLLMPAPAAGLTSWVLESLRTLLVS
ncbi:MAG: transcription-repair coupling factor [Actinomycetota bacterium]